MRPGADLQQRCVLITELLLCGVLQGQLQGWGGCHFYKENTDEKIILIVVSDKRKQSGNEASPRSAVEPNSCEPAGISLASK